MPSFIPSRYRALDNDGDPISGGKLNFYDQAGTSRKDTFSDQALTSANANPVVADANGWFGPIYMETDAQYTVVFTDASDVTIWSQNGVRSAHISGQGMISDSSALTTYGVTASADTTTPVSSALRIVPQDAGGSVALEGDYFADSTKGGQLHYYDGDISLWLPVGPLVTKTVVTAAQVKDLNATPIELVAAPPSGTSLVYERGVAILQAGSVAYTGAHDIIIEHAGGYDVTVAIDSTDFNNGTGAGMFFLLETTSTDSKYIDGPTNDKLQLTTSSTDPGAGDRDLHMWVWYRILKLT
jgi:hypothetical protein